LRETARRINGGLPLRRAMTDQKIGLQALAAKINQAADPPVSFQLIGFLSTSGGSARETTTPRTADLIEDALSVPRGTLFERLEIPEKADLLPETARR
jgi:hypothetical protein